jgi:hypothetical protein
MRGAAVVQQWRGRMVTINLAPVDQEIEPFVRKSAGGSWFSSKGSMLWTEQTSNQAQAEATLSHELSHFFVHVATPYGRVLETLGQLQERFVLKYCEALAEKGLPVHYPVYQFAQRENAPTETSLVAEYVQPWSRLVHLERILDGSNVKAVRDATIPDAVELLAYLEDVERAVLVADGGNPADLGERPSLATMLRDARDRLVFEPACPRFQSSREDSLAGGEALFEGLAQAAERMVYPDHWDMLARGMTRDQYLGFYTSVFVKYGTDRIHSQRDFDRVFETFIALCDLALQTPIGSIYGRLRTPECDYGDLHPGYRFIRLLDWISDDDWIDSLDDLPGMQQTMAARLGWADPHLFQLHGSAVDSGVHSEAMRIRLQEPTFHLFLQERTASSFLTQYGPLIRDPRTGRVMPTLSQLARLRPVVGFVLWRLTWQVMMGPQLDVDEALPEGIYGRLWWQNIDTKEDLAALVFDAHPALNPQHFILI